MDDQLWCLKEYDVAYIVDDSSSMSWKESRSGIVPWEHARNALRNFATICAEWDQNGQDLYFINYPDPILNASPQMILNAFESRSPLGGTNMGRRLMAVAADYFEDYTTAKKPLNLLCITDGQFSDDVASVIVWIVNELDRRHAPPNQFGIQFVQIGADRDAERCLRALDDDLGRGRLSRDIVDTVPWIMKKTDGVHFDGDYLVKVVCGAINKNLDRKGVNPLKKKLVFRRMFS